MLWLIAAAMVICGADKTIINLNVANKWKRRLLACKDFTRQLHHCPRPFEHEVYSTYESWELIDQALLVTIPLLNAASTHYFKQGS
jgi:hypothetical protein